MIVTKQNLKFVRYGGLSPVIQNGYNPATKDFHSPPARRGIYAFVYGFEEIFLLSSMYFCQHRMEWVKDKNGNRINHSHPDFDRLYDRYYCRFDKKREEENLDFQYLCKHKKRKIFTYQGDIWHHLDSTRFKKENGAWFLSSYDDYIEILQKEMHSRIKKERTDGIGYSLDNLEVFIEKP